MKIELTKGQLNIHGTVYDTNLNNKYINRKPYKIPDIKKLESVIPGTVLEVFVKEGQVVKEGDSLLILEAMKMKNDVLSHFSGKVAKIYVASGERIPKGYLMVEFE